MENNTGNESRGGWFEGPLRHKAKAIVCILVIMGLVVAATYFSTKSYRSEGGLYFRLGRENSTLDPTAAMGESVVVTSAGSREREMNSILEIAKSRAAAEQLVDAVGVDEILTDANNGEPPAEGEPGLTAKLGVRPELPPRDKAIEHVQERLEVKAASDANIVWVAYEAQSPEFAQQVVDQFIKSYLDLHVKHHRNPSSANFLSEQAEKSKMRLAQLEDALTNTKTELAMAAPDEQRSATVNQAARLELALLENEAIEASVQKQVDKLRELIENEPETRVISETSGISNDAADRMRDRLYQLQIQEQNLLSRKTKSHPEVITLRQQIKESQSILAKENDSRTEVTKGINRARQTGEIELLNLLPTLEMYRAKSVALRERFNNTAEQLNALANKESQINQLTREVELADAEYRRFAAGRDQAKLEAALEFERISNVNVIQAATLSRKPVRPNWLINLSAGFVLALGISWGLTSILVAWRPAQQSVVQPSTPAPARRPTVAREDVEDVVAIPRSTPV